jgi:predicted nucleic acid-binding protein
MDALQLASALIARERFGSLPFVTLDSNLASAARAEGFVVLP